MNSYKAQGGSSAAGLLGAAIAFASTAFAPGIALASALAFFAGLAPSVAGISSSFYFQKKINTVLNKCFSQSQFCFQLIDSFNDFALDYTMLHHSYKARLAAGLLGAGGRLAAGIVAIKGFQEVGAAKEGLLRAVGGFKIAKISLGISVPIDIFLIANSIVSTSEIK